MNTARKIAASGTIGLGLAMVSVALPGIANAADTEEVGASVPAGAPTTAEISARAQALGLDIPADQLAGLDMDDLEALARDLDDDETTAPTPTPEPTTPDPTTPDPTIPTPTIPTPTPGDPTTAPTTPAPTSPTRPTPGDSIDPGGETGDVESGDDSTPGDDTGDSDPGSGSSESQGGNTGSSVDPVLGTGVAPQSATAPTDAPEAGALPDAGSPGQLPVLVLGLGLIVVGGVLVKRPYAARHRVV
ncbi:hypothetical protein GEV27_02245 [Aeromicrobium sp. S22]|uniref:hypothetical protein n=1 Tax=Aeromicrobium sp. S22 TaxID=2662029 RepID=UPI00129D9724|nr:hypothetical protein [Aeromicrobium sp. S22]MRK00334.1 hypothetical protein [Aeromicrobium sp. S22]